MLRSPSLVEQVKNHLKQRIARAEFKDGRIPAEADLARDLNVSRNTIRDALSRLETEGFILRKQGAGTFVNQAGLTVKSRLEEVVLYENQIRECGYEPAIHLLGVEEHPAPPDVLESLNLAPHDRVVVVKKQFFADNKPIIFIDTLLPQKIIREPYTPDDLRPPIYDFLSKFCWQTFTYYLTEIVPVVPPAWLAESLDISPQNLALISFEETGYNQNNEPIVKSTSYFRDDLLRLRLIRRMP